MQLKIYTLAVAVLLMGCASTSSLTSKGTETERTPSSAQTWPDEMVVGYQTDMMGNQTSELRAKITPSHIKEAFSSQVSTIEDINDISIRYNAYTDGVMDLTHEITFRVQFNDTIPSEADNKLSCFMSIEYLKPTNQVQLSFYSCRSQNVSFKFKYGTYRTKPLSIPIKLIRLDNPKIFVIEFEEG